MLANRVELVDVGTGDEQEALGFGEILATEARDWGREQRRPSAREQHQEQVIRTHLLGQPQDRSGSGFTTNVGYRVGGFDDLASRKAMTLGVMILRHHDPGSYAIPSDVLHGHRHRGGSLAGRHQDQLGISWKLASAYDQSIAIAFQSPRHGRLRLNGLESSPEELLEQRPG
jgi:hypothetical protein